MPRRGAPHPPPSHRQRQAQRTRDLVTAAARELFARDGYVATSIDAISNASGVPVQTIYSAFGSKAAILEEIRVGWIRDAGVVALHAEAMSALDPREGLRRIAKMTRQQFVLGHDVIAMCQEAARADPRAADAWRAAMSGREHAVRQLLGALRGRLRAGLTQKQALDVYIACTLPETYRTLVLERGWSPARYEAWLADLLATQLLG